MKKILFKKILLDCNIFFLIALISTSIIIWVFQAVNFLDIIIDDGRSYAVYINYTLLSFPKIISKIFPFALFFSFSYVLSKYELNNELMIFWNYGISKINVINFFLIFSILLMTLQLVLTSFLVPKFQNLSRNLIKNSDTDYFENFLKPKRFIDTISGLTFFIEEKSKNGLLKNIYIKKETGRDKFQTTFAKSGIFKTKNSQRVLVLYDGQTLSGSKDDLKVINFSVSDFSLNQTETGIIKINKLQENSSIELIKCIKRLKGASNKNEKYKQYDFHNCTIANFENIFKELYKRIIIPLYIPLFIFIALLVTVRSKEKVNYSRYRTLIFISGLLLMIFSESTLKVAGNNLIINIFLIILPLLILIIFYSIMFYFLKLKLSKLKI
jgi:lipopolysaccharide export system permease protein